MKQQKILNTNKGITLIALVITIVVMLILVAVTISMAVNGGLFNYAGKASGDTNNAIKAEQQLANGGVEVDGKWYSSIDEYLGTIGGNKPVENPYEADEWKYAWICQNEVWDNTKYEAGAELPEGEGIVVAKIYETGKRITPPDLVVGDTETYTFTEGNEYVMVIEGQGDMGQLMTEEGNNITGAFGWQLESAAFLMDPINQTCTMPYVSEVIICDGVTNIGSVAFMGDTGLKKVTIGNDVEGIGRNAFSYCVSLTDIAIPDGVTCLELATFYHCESLTNVTIPDSVTSIGDSAFRNCTSLTKVKILVTDVSNFSVVETAFNSLAENSVIYVLSEEIKTKISGTYDTSKTTVQVVTMEQMNAI